MTASRTVPARVDMRFRGGMAATADVDVRRLERSALVWGHCHHKATGGIDGEQQLLERMGLDVESVSGGCCGLAGSWGFEQGHHDVSIQCGEQALLPAVRDEDPDTIVVADGFSCKTQIEQGDTGRRALHVAQVMKMAREHGIDGYCAGAPEAPYYERRPELPRAQSARRAGAAATIAAAAAVATVAVRRG